MSNGQWWRGQNRWFIVACLFLGVNIYGVLQYNRGRSVPAALPSPALDAPASVTTPKPPQPPEPPPPELISVLQTDVNEEGFPVMELKFNHVVSPEVLKKFLTVTGTSGEPLNLTIYERDPDSIILFALDADPNDSLTLNIREGFFAENSPTPLRQPLRRRIPLPEGLSLTDINVDSPSFEQAWIQIRFSGPVDPASLQRAITLEPAVEFSLVEKQNWRFGRFYELHGKLEKGRNYHLVIDKGVKAAAGKNKLTQEVERTIFIPDADAAIRLRLQGNYLSPRGAMLLPLESVNVETYTMQAARLPAHNLVQYAMREGGHYQSYYGDPEAHITAASTSRTFRVETPKNAVTAHVAPLRDLLPTDARGAWMLDVKLNKDDYRHESRLLVVTDTGITVKRTGGDLLVWANSIHDLSAVTGAAVKVWSPAAELLAEGGTDTAGLATLALTDGADPFMVTVEDGNDLAYLNLRDTQLPSLASPARWPYLRDGSAEAFVYTDRGVYRPGETAHVRAIVRGRYLQTPAVFPVELHIVRPDGRPYKRLQAMLSGFGTAEFEIPWAEFDATGSYRLTLKTPGAEQAIGETVIGVEEFVPPRMAVEATTDLPTYAMGTEGRVSIAARYLHGAPAGGSPVSAQLDLFPVPFKSAKFPDHRFGDDEKSMSRTSKNLGSGALDAEGKCTYPLPLQQMPDAPSMLRGIAAARVMEQGGRTVSGYVQFDVHPYPFYIGLRGVGLQDLRPGDKGRVEIALVETDGIARSEIRSLEARLERIEWSSVLSRDGQGRYSYQSVRRLVPIASQKLDTGDDGSAVYAPEAVVAGNYLLRVIDPQSGASSSLQFYAGGEHDRWQSRSMERTDRVELAWDKPRYQPGDVARLTITAPFTGKALLTIEQDHLLSSAVQTLTSNTTVFEIPVTTNHQPNAHAFVNVIREVSPSPGQMVYRAAGSIPLLLDESPLRLTVGIDAPAVVRPLSRLQLDMTVADGTAKGMHAEVAVALVDEGICMLTDFKTPDPVSYFSALRRHDGITSDLYALLLPETDPETALYSASTGGDVAKELRGRLNPIRSRRFKPVALWQGGVTTDAAGRCRMAFDIPEFSGALRVMAVAVAGGQFGSADQMITVNRPFSILSSLPRFLAPGDTCTMPLELFNGSDQAQDATIVVRATGPVAVGDGTSQTIHIPAGGRAQVAYTVQAEKLAGLARITIEGSMGGEAVSETIELSIRPPSPTITVLECLALAAGEKTTIDLPGGWLPGSATVTLQVDGLPSGSLGGGLDYLLGYPYGCLEQTTSAAMPLLYVDALQREIASTRYVNNVGPMVRQGINRVLSMQTGNGSFGWWPQATDAYEWGSVYAMHFLIEAQRAGYELPEYQRDAGLNFMRELLSRPVRSANNVKSAEWRSDASLRSYACLVLALAGSPRHDWTERLREQADMMYRDSRLNLVLALAAGGRRRDAFTELKALEQTKTAFTDYDELGSPTRTAALELTAWLELAPDDASIPKRLHRLEDSMRNGRWCTTQENGAAVSALARYMRQTASRQTNFSGHVEQSGVKMAVTSEPGSGTVKLAEVAPIKLSNQGPGTLYATWQVRGIPAEGLRANMDQRISIRRSFLDTGGNTIPVETVRQGDLLIVRWQIDTHGQVLDHLVIEDLLSAGFEIENASLKTSQLVPWVREKSTMPVRHQDIRDDRLIVFTSQMQGTLDFYYAVRAVTPGQYVRPPVTVSAMYDPDVESIHDGGSVTVEAVGEKSK